MSAEQLRQIILDAYEARPETKEYFEFFLNPDVEKLQEKYRNELIKELNRNKWGQSKARVMRIKKMLANALMLRPGIETELNLMFDTLRLMGIAERGYYFSDAQFRLVDHICEMITGTAERNRIFDEAITRFINILEEPVITDQFKRHIKGALAEAKGSL